MGDAICLWVAEFRLNTSHQPTPEEEPPAAQMDDQSSANVGMSAGHTIVMYEVLHHGSTRCPLEERIVSLPYRYRLARSLDFHVSVGFAKVPERSAMPCICADSCSRHGVANQGVPCSSHRARIYQLSTWRKHPTQTPCPFGDETNDRPRPFASCHTYHLLLSDTSRCTGVNLGYKRLSPAA